MGNGIAHTFAQSGFTVKLIDVSEKSIEKGMATIAGNLDRMVAKGSITEDDKHKTIGNIITETGVPTRVVLVLDNQNSNDMSENVQTYVGDRWITTDVFDVSDADKWIPPLNMVNIDVK